MDEALVAAWKESTLAALDLGIRADGRGGGGLGRVEGDLWHRTSTSGVREGTASGGGVVREGRWHRTRRSGSTGEGGERRGQACVRFFC
jgi:hypothetical protein